MLGKKLYLYIISNKIEKNIEASKLDNAAFCLVYVFSGGKVSEHRFGIFKTV